jgi:hypothetical protein
MAGEKPKPTLENVLGITGLSGYMRNLGPGVVGLTRGTRQNYELGMANAAQRYRVNRNIYANENAANSGRARIHYAAIHGDVQLLRKLVNRGADPDMTLNGKTPLILALENNQPGVVEELCKLGANINRPMVNGETALHLAVYYSNFRIVNLLLNCGADVTIGAGTIMTPLHIAAFNGNEQMIDLLLKRGATATLNAKTMNLAGQETPLHMAISSGCLGCVKLLLHAGADVTIEDSDHQTPIQRAGNEFDSWYDRWEGREGDEGYPPVSASRRAYQRERLEQAHEILNYLKDMVDEPSAGGRRHGKHRGTRRRKARKSNKSRKH